MTIIIEAMFSGYPFGFFHSTDAMLGPLIFITLGSVALRAAVGLLSTVGEE